MKFELTSDDWQSLAFLGTGQSGAPPFPDYPPLSLEMCEEDWDRFISALAERVALVHAPSPVPVGSRSSALVRRLQMELFARTAQPSAQNAT